MGVERRKRVGVRIKEEISELLLTKVRDPRIGFVTITDVELTTDLRRATVFYSVMGDEQEKFKAAQGLKSACGFIKKEMASRLNLKFMPEIVFALDTSFEEMDRMERVFRQLELEKERREHED